MQITFLTRKFRNAERNLHCDVAHITTKWVSSLTLDCNGVFAIKAYASDYHLIAVARIGVSSIYAWRDLKLWRDPELYLPSPGLNTFSYI